MRLLQAGSELAEAVSEIIVRQMARALIEDRPVDLRDGDACLVRLSHSGFGAPSIAALAERARLMAVELISTRDRS